jgi:hypothetical protein
MHQFGFNYKGYQDTRSEKHKKGCYQCYQFYVFMNKIL